MKRHIHFIGIGGISMSTLAAIAKTRGDEVTGSDRAPSHLTDRLQNEMGIRIFFPQSRENVGDADVVVYTAAISDDNPELFEARKRGIKCIPHSEYLGQIMLDYPCRIGVSGTHGKSSTTGMLASVFMTAGADPTVACGAELQEFHGAYRLGKGEHFIYEACEYKDSFLDFYPSIAVVLNIEMDHVDYFHSMRQMEESYRQAALKAGAAVVNWDDPHVRGALGRLPGVWTVRTSKERDDADYTAANVREDGGFYSFDLMKESEKLCGITLKVPGLHHVSNALCAAATAHICGVSPEDIAKGLGDYKGVCRRFEYLGTYGGARVYDDYAHHPTEIEATLTAARRMAGDGGRILCVFQPHTYSRTAGLFDGFVHALSLADRVYLAPIYAAREINTYGVSSHDLAKRIEGAEAFANFDEIAKAVKNELREGDLLLTMGAGSAYVVANALLEKGGV